ncbi:MAG: hypothetical protein FWF22_04780 [Treponema sp.]|nr:hypothetical protein [Treponema sp.]
MNKIGTYRESSLHRDLKYRYSGTGKTEIPVGDYVCDGQSDSGELIEVQTGSFGPLREKVKKLTLQEKIRIIYPVIISKYIEVYDVEGKLLRKRRSPGKGCIWDVFNALLYAPDLCLAPRLTLELVLLDITEKRKDDGKGTWRRKGITIVDKIPEAWHESVIIKKPKDYNLFIPFKTGETFTVSDLCGKAGISAALARKCLYVLNKAGLVERTGKQGNAYVYKKKAAG